MLLTDSEHASVMCQSAYHQIKFVWQRVELSLEAWCVLCTIQEELNCCH
jgi:hypothetical protein